MVSLDEQLELKIRLENRFKPELKRVFNMILQDFKSSYASRGVPPRAQRYTPAWQMTIENHYRRTQKAFKNVVKNPKKQKEDDDKKELLALALLTWREQNVGKHAEWLTHTTQVNMTEAIRLAREQFAQDGIVPTDRDIALAATAILRRKFEGRLSSIAMSETQAGSESTKFIGAEIESDLTPKILGGGLVATLTIKMWRTMGDSKVRKIHRTAEGQSVPLTQPYIVDNEYLMYPGDSSMGASAGNTANCRCMSDFFF